MSEESIRIFNRFVVFNNYIDKYFMNYYKVMNFYLNSKLLNILLFVI